MAAPSMSDVLTDASIIPLFVYGTIRQGGSLHNHWVKDITQDVEPATADGYRLYRPSVGGWFPFMVPLDTTARGYTHEHVVGDLLWVRTGPRLNQLISMEVNAGYDLAMVDVSSTLAVDLPALSFVWQRPVPRDWKPVPCNDFFVRA